jgi:hypothetical protein
MTSSPMCVTVPLTGFVNVTITSGSGAAGLLLPENPGRAPSAFAGFGSSVTNTEWASYAALFDEYRVKAILVEYVPNTTNPTSTFTVQFATCCDYDSEITAGSLTGVQQVLRYASGRLLNPTVENQIVFQPPRSRAFTSWQSTANGLARGCVYLFLNSSVSGTLNIGSAVVKYIVTFRQSNG